MNKLLSDLTVLYTKLHTLHYNVVGEGFYPVHVMLEGQYDKVHELIDEVAESTKMVGELPIGTTKEMLEISTIKEIESRDYTSKEVFEILLVDFEMMYAEIDVLKKDVKFFQTNLLEDIQTYLIKQIWFLKASLK